jgi:flagellar hook-associated protein 3 FlgL
MTRISENQLARSLLVDIARNREQYSRFSQELATGYKVIDPGDSKFAGTIARYRESLDRLAGHRTRAEAVTGQLAFQDNILSQANEILVRANELATQGANETVGVQVRAQMAEEVFELRAHLVSLANSKYQGRYVFGGLDDGDEPFGASTYGNPASGPASERWIYDDTTAEPANGLSRSVNITDDLRIVVTKPGDQIFSNALAALERLGRALAGFQTLPPTGLPDGTGAALNLPTDISLQTQEIQSSINFLKKAREEDILPERVTIGAGLRRLQTALSLIDLTETDAKETLSKLQDADIAESGTGLQQAQIALEVSYQVTTQALQLNILRFL